MRSCLLLLSMIFCSLHAFGQSRGVNIGRNSYGIGLGCFAKHHGIRLGLIDKGCGSVAGLNVAVRSNVKKVSGISLALLISDDTVMNGVSFASLSSYSQRARGLVMAGLGAGGAVISGVGIAGAGLAADTLNGVFMSGFGIAYWNEDTISLINGVAAGIIGGCFAKQLNGLSVGLFHNVVGVQNGVCIAAWNRARELHGIQIGLINYAANNRKAFRWLPLVNMNFRKKTSRKSQRSDPDL